ncbi:hypothetical protein [Candidatus Chlorohelix sp.]|uniref:hypothetical protein n=1 Tax=Candidatus Chlorohelix sp. TaxID=3139201 RepID=UPI00306EC3EA
MKNSSGFWFRHAIPFGLYLLGAIIFTYPLVLNLGSRIISTPGSDGWQNLWHLWWVKHSLIDLRALPYYTEMLYYPQRIDLLLDPLNVTTGTLSIPLQYLFGLVVTFNIWVLLAITLAGYCTYLLAGYLSNNYSAAIIAGFIFAFSPIISLWLNLGQLELLSAFWLPLFALLYLKTLKGKGRWQGYAGFTAFSFVLMSLTSWYFTYYGLIFAGLILLYRLISREEKWRGLLLRGIGTLLLSGVALLPIVLRTAGAVGGEQNVGRQSTLNFWLNSVALLDLIKPAPTFFWKAFGFSDNANQRWLFLGFIALALALLGLAVNFKKQWFWGVTGLIFLELALGPTLRFDSSNNLFAKAADAENGILTPNRLLYALPFGDIARRPLVSLILVMLVCGILATFGLDFLLKRVQNYRLKATLPAIVALLIFLEFIPIPRPLAEASINSFYQKLADTPDNFAVIDLPDKSDVLAMYYQTAHEKPMVGGYIARALPYPFAQTPGIKELRSTTPSALSRDIFDPNTLENTPAVLHYFNIRYVIYHLNLTDTVSDSYRKAHLEYINEVFQAAPPYYRDSEIVVWRVPDLPGATKPCGAKAILPGRLGGWNERQFTESGEVFRWMDGNAEVNFFNPSKQPLRAKFDTSAYSWNQARRLQLWQNKSIVFEAQVGTELAPLHFELTLQPGDNRIQFKTAEPGTKEGNRTQAIAFLPFVISNSTAPNCG